jgi:peptidoglycan/xylan/chitin deacetylase (PgdA/CDA1 family)
MSRMTGMKAAVIKAAMSGLYRTGAHRLVAPYTQGLGLILTLHRVKPTEPRAFEPNRALEISPEFLEAVLDQVEEADLDVVTLDEAVQRLRAGEGRRFVCFTFDGAYRDTLTYAYPIFKRRSLPLTLYVPTDYPFGRGELWWLALEEIVQRAEDIELCRAGGLWHLPTATPQEKARAYDQIYWWLRSLDEATQRRVSRALSDCHDVDLAAMCADLVMTWDDIRMLAADPLVTVGAQTKAHYALANLSTEKAVSEMRGSADVIEHELGTRPTHLSFPYGDEGSVGGRDFALAKELRFKTAVTMRKGVLSEADACQLTALPRVLLNGDYQSLAYTALYLSGATFMLRSRWQQARAA